MGWAPARIGGRREGLEIPPLPRAMTGRTEIAGIGDGLRTCRKANTDRAGNRSERVTPYDETCRSSFTEGNRDRGRKIPARNLSAACWSNRRIRICTRAANKNALCGDHEPIMQTFLRVGLCPSRVARDRPMGVPKRGAFWSNQWAR